MPKVTTDKIYKLLTELDGAVSAFNNTPRINYTLRAMASLVTALVILTHNLDYSEDEEGG